MEIKPDNTERDMKLRAHKCGVCGSQGMFQSYLVSEMMYKTGDDFEYFICPECECLQIGSIPDNLSRYYKNDYYSYNIGDATSIVLPSEPLKMTKILDIGCGNGDWLRKCAGNGYGNLYGCDPFIESDIKYGEVVNIRKCTIHEIEGAGSFDYIRMSDSFEHVTDPAEVLLSARNLLKEDGIIELSIPTYPNIAFDMFGPYWCQLDAPRHIFLHSEKSIRFLAKKSGLNVTEIKYDSDAGQIIGSFFYQHNVSFYDIDEQLIRRYFSEQERNEIEILSKEANEKHYGDHMKVYLEKTKEEK